MPLRIFTNISSLNSQRMLGINNEILGKAFSRIASGIRIQQASDDAAGMSISETLRADTRTLRQGVKNINDGISMINTAEGAMSEQSGILIRMRELASQAATGTIGQTVRRTINLEFLAMRSELDRIAAVTEFGGQKLLDGSLSAATASADHVVLHVGTTSGSESRINLNLKIDLTAPNSANFGLTSLSIATEAGATAAMDVISSAIKGLIQIRARVGAVQQSLARAVSNLNVTVENLTSALSTIRDADLAEEISNLTRRQVMVQSGAAMVSQANLTPANVLTLLES